ncbi:hypothetical protein ABIE26_003611 [Pedobacter africanus]|uniref:hypothetical protein n=1 Tax=Pedobacter africanus TaxID=151894 RepID=UPI0033978D36
MTLFVIAGFLLGCNPSASLEGTYINNAASEFSIADDTLVVEQSEGNRYLLHRSTGFRLLNDKGKPGKLQYEKEEWTAVYDTDADVLRESRNGIIITFNADRSIMTAGKRKYKQIK